MPPQRGPYRVKTPPRPCRTALVSVHDVTPETLPRVEEIVCFLRAGSVSTLTLLVVPGSSWSPGQVRRLRSWQDGGIELAAHGWLHRARRIHGLRHRLHARAISRGEAEHLALSEPEIDEVVRRSHGWFARVGLRSPSLYVPPAWAPGRLPTGRRRALPFSYYETLHGVYDARRHEGRWMPLTGYMADTRLRTVLLKNVNALLLRLSWPVVRIALHPEDLRLPLREDLVRHLGRFQQFSTYTELMRRTPPKTPARSAGRHASFDPPPLQIPPSRERKPS